MIWFLIAVGLILYFLLDVHYFLRVIFTYVYAKYGRSKINFLESSEVYGKHIILIVNLWLMNSMQNKSLRFLFLYFSGVCLPSDADFMITHMNNSRFLREYDFARFDLTTRNGVMDEVMKRGGSFPVSAISVRYRLPLMMFSTYKVL